MPTEDETFGDLVIYFNIQFPNKISPKSTQQLLKILSKYESSQEYVTPSESTATPSDTASNHNVDKNSTVKTSDSSSTSSDNQGSLLRNLFWSKTLTRAQSLFGSHQQ